MDNTTKWILFIFFVPGLFWDAGTTFSGVSQYTNGGLFPFVLTVFINGILAFTFIKLQKTEFVGLLSGLMWLGAFAGDLTTSFFGNWNVAGISTPTPIQYFLIGLSALFTTGSTIAISYIVFKEDFFGFYAVKK
jgi:hypothetical protein